MFQAVAVNPFAKVSFGARIPDGKAALSVGTRVQQRKQLKQSGSADAMNIFLYPGVNCCVGAVGADNQTAGVFLSSATHLSVSGTTTYEQTSDATLCNKWRTVSCGMNISLINNSDTDEGWFEAIRLSPSSSANPPLVNNACAFDVNDPTGYPGCKLDSENLVHQPSYVSGKLRDIHKYLFALNPHSGDHEFNNLVKQGGQTKDLYDQSHDAILVRIYGKPDETTVLVHSAHNQELFYDEECPMSRFHGPTRTYPASVAKANRACQSRVGAGILVVGNATTPIQKMGATAPRMRIVRRSPPARRYTRRLMARRPIRKRVMKRAGRYTKSTAGRWTTRKKPVLRKSGYGLRLGM